jgi:hypothetical protein
MFEQTQTKFDQGRAPNAQELLGWKVGRCYYSQYGDPDVAYAGIAFGVDHVTGHAPGDLKILIGPPRDYATPADQFDNPSEDIKSQLQDMIVDPYYDQLTTAEVKNGYMHSTLASNDRDYRARIFVDQSDAKHPVEILVSEGIVISTGAVRMACFHDKLIHE